jgi:hypothetical protein
MPSDAFTESSQASSADGADTTQRLGAGPGLQAYGNGNAGGHGFGRHGYGGANGSGQRRFGHGHGSGQGNGHGHGGNPSMSSLSGVSDVGGTDHLFALEEQPGS